MRMLVVVFCVAGLGCHRSASADETRREFEVHYQQWLIDCRQPDVAIYSDFRPYVCLPSCRAIVAMGPKALPYIHEKMRENRWAAIMLPHAVAEIEGTEKPPACHPTRPNQSMKPTAPLQGAVSMFATTPRRGLSLSR
jgi:hypothetical protein